MEVNYFTVSDARFFLGTVGLINSLRVTGNRQPIVVLDGGFTPEQRQLLSPHCTLMPLPDIGFVQNPQYYKLIAPRAVRSEIAVVIDSDMVVTGALDELLAAAESGKVVAYPDPEPERWFAEWEEIFRLPAPPRHQVYVNSGVVIFSTRHFPDLLDQWWAACRITQDRPTVYEGALGPTSQSDQDALNSILMSHYPPGAVSLRPADEAPQAGALNSLRLFGVAVTNPKSLACEYRGQRTLILHAAGHPKPWISEELFRNTAYVQLLRRLFASADVPIRLPEAMIPRCLKQSLITYSLVTGLHWRTRGLDFARLLRKALTQPDRAIAKLKLLAARFRWR